MPVRRLSLLIGLALAACSPGTERDEPGADESRPRNPFFGEWRTVTAQVAPWWDQQGEPPEMDQEFQTRPIVFEAGQSSGPEIVACEEPVYTINLVRAKSLFEGNLPDPATGAAALGFSEPDVTSLNLSCTTDDASVSLDFAMVDETTILLGLDNMIYTLKRQ